MSNHLYSDCQRCPYFSSVDKIVKLKAIMESQQQDIEHMYEALEMAERYMTEKGVSHEYPVLIKARKALAKSKGVETNDRL